MRSWQIQEAKTHLSELVREAEHLGPQEITWHGRPVAVVISRVEDERLTGTHASLVAFMQSSPLSGYEDVEFERDKGLTREVAL